MRLQAIQLPNGYRILILCGINVTDLPVDWIEMGEGG